MKRMAPLLLIACRLLVIGVFVSLASESSNTADRLIGEVGPSMVAEAGNVTAIQSFDISSDGNRIALLYQTGKYQNGFPANPERRIAVWDVLSKRILGQAKIGDENDLISPTHASNPAGPIFDENYVFLKKRQSQVILSPDQRHIIAMSLGKVWILDGRNCSIIHSIDSPRFSMVAPVDIQTVSDSILVVTYEYAYQQFEVDFYGLATGNKVGGWISSAIPQSFSPDGKLAVTSDPTTRNDGGVTNVQVVDVRTGAKIMSIPVGFRFRKTWLGLGRNPTAGGIVVSRFLSNEEIVVTPGGNRDGGGYSSGNRLEIIDVLPGRIVREIRPKQFGPTGVLVESIDHSHFVVESLYASPASFAYDSPRPKDYKHEIIVFANSGTVPEAVFPYPGYPILNKPPKISADASTMAIEVNGEVQVFRLRE